MESIATLMTLAVWIMGGLAGVITLGVVGFFVVRRAGAYRGQA